MTPPVATAAPSSTGRDNRTWLLQLAYEGTPYAGWQIQPSQLTVEGVLTAAIHDLFKDPTIRLCGCSRTDAGVHALSQLVSVKLPVETVIPPKGAQNALNSRLPNSVRIRQISECPDDFYLHGCVCGKAYTYVIHQGILNCPFQGNYCWCLRDQLDLSAILQAAAILTTAGNFSAFSVNRRDERTVHPQCQLYDWQIRSRGRFLILTVIGDRFLYKMVRRLIGFLVKVGQGRLDASIAAELLNGPCDARFCTAPPQGLFLEAVFLNPDELRAYQSADLPFLQLIS